MAEAYTTRNISDIVQKSAVADDVRLMRTGLDAAGLTAEFDAACEKANRKVMEMFPDEQTRQEVIERSLDSDRRIRESLRQYEIQQVVAGAERESVIKLDNMQKGFAEYATLEMGRLEKERSDNLEKETKAYEARLAEIARLKEHDNDVTARMNEAIDGAKDGEEAYRNLEKMEKYDSYAAKKAAKEAYEERCRALQAVYDKGVKDIGARFHALGEDMHTVHFNSRKTLMDDDSAANAISSLETGKRMKGLIAGFVKSGYTSLAGSLIDRYSSKDATGVPIEREKYDKDGKVVLDRNGKHVMENVLDKDGNIVYDMSKYNPGGRVWMSMADIGELRDGLDSEMAERERKAAATAKSIAADAKAEANAIEIDFMEKVRKSAPEKAEAILDAYMGELLKRAAGDPEAVRQVQGRMISEVKSMAEKAEKRRSVYQGALRRYGAYGTSEAISRFNTAMTECDSAYARSVAVKYIDGRGKVAETGDVDADFVVAAHCDAMLERTDLDADMRMQIKERRREALERKRAKEEAGFMKAIASMGFIRRDIQSLPTRYGERRELEDAATGVQAGEQVYLSVGSGGKVEVDMAKGEMLTFVYTVKDGKDTKDIEFKLGKAEAETLFAALFREYEMISSSHDTVKGKEDTEKFASIVKNRLIDAHMKSVASERFNWLSVADSIGVDIHDRVFDPMRFENEKQLSSRMTFVR